MILDDTLVTLSYLFSLIGQIGDQMDRNMLPKEEASNVVNALFGIAEVLTDQVAVTMGVRVNQAV